MGTRVVIYARLSEDHERAESIPTQISNSTKHAKHMGWEVMRVFKDEGRSGYSGEFRPGFEDMLKFLNRSEIQVLIARHHDRLTCNAEDFDRLMKNLWQVQDQDQHLHRRRAGSVDSERRVLRIHGDRQVVV